MWCLEGNIHIIAQHLPGVQNEIADAESRTIIDRSDWQLNPVLFNRIIRLFGGGHVCLSSNHSVPSLFQLATRSLCSGNRCISAGLSRIQGYANPPRSMIGRVLSQVQTHMRGSEACIILVAPVRKTQPWYPLLLGMLVTFPYLITHSQPMLSWDPLDLVPQLAVWHISGGDTETRSFRRKLPLSCLNPGELSH